jgi:hypothetical protein
MRYIAFCLVARERKVPPAPAETPKIHLLPILQALSRVARRETVVVHAPRSMGEPAERQCSERIAECGARRADTERAAAEDEAGGVPDLVVGRQSEGGADVHLDRTRRERVCRLAGHVDRTATVVRDKRVSEAAAVGDFGGDQLEIEAVVHGRARAMGHRDPPFGGRDGSTAVRTLAAA